MTEIEISKIDIAEWDARKTKEDNEDIEALMQSIEKDGLISPVLVTPKGDRFLLLAGRRRLLAHKLLGKKTIDSKIDIKAKSKGDAARLTYMENHIRKELSEEERAIGLLEVYQHEGYTGEDAISFLKCLHNHKYKIGKTDFNTFAKNLWQQGVVSTNIPPKAFVDLAERLAYSPNTQYQWLQLAVQMEREALAIMQKYKLDRKKMTLLTHSPLCKHPKIQMSLARMVALLPIEEARVIVYQAIRDLETGALQKVGSGYLRAGSKSDKLSREIILQPTEHYLKIESILLKLFPHMTDRPLTRGEYEYNEEIVEKTKSHRLKIVKTLTDSELRVLRHDMQIFGSLSQEFLNLIASECKDRTRKEEFLKK
jgi:hypothetical protein